MRVHVLRDSTAEATPLLLVHALPLDHRMWVDVAAHIPSARRVLAIDLPDRADPPGEPSFDAVADDLAQVLGTQPVVVAGCSMGGYLALALADRHPHLVAGLGLVDTRAEADDDQALARRAATVAQLEGSGSLDAVRAAIPGLLGATTSASRPEVTDQVRCWVDEQTPETVAWCHRAIGARPDRTETLRTFTGPVSVVVGDEDALSGVDVAQAMAATARDARLVVVPQAGHLSPVEQPALVAQALAELVQRTDA
ncbi:MAG: alpha/beta hydrolase [Micrococcales bacterium]|nr:alpha/beta hydrolase [Micrococcales bacterium]